ncbi:1,4-alpha-glucan branching protein GlgB [Paeniclostridium hominis]|uniref:1,4-alpha-glucan branching protein GlgB n=1 Tax=Paeniclostridium hominis TaxID=2764329 RepID=UPI0022E5C3F6|nr:1,4-alpha-glucan branching protein GlgB [Paeniclostridium hominis]
MRKYEDVINSYNINLFKEGKCFRSYSFMGAHKVEKEGITGIVFSVWAPNAKKVSLVGAFNNWDESLNVMNNIEDSGIWNIFIPNMEYGENYKFYIESKSGKSKLKSDPYAFFSEKRPNTASIVYDLKSYTWNDDIWIEKKEKYSYIDKPMNIYEVHLGSWKRKWDGEFFTYEEFGELIDYVEYMGYTHIELLPITEHPLDMSWGYQTIGYYSATSRYGDPQQLMRFVDKCHQKNIGVIFDFAYSHFCKDDHGLYKFDGTNQFEYEDETKSENLGWGTAHFDLGKPEVQSFLISNAIFWMEKFHVDGIRMDAVSSMLYLDYDIGHWKPNKYGGRENIEAIEFLRMFNEILHKEVKNPIIIAEESTSWQMVTGPAYKGGLAFDNKWNMGWMNDTLKYMEMDPIYRKYHHELITFSFMYAFSENFIIPLSHDEVVHGKKSLLNKMPGDEWQKFANLRLLYAYMMIHPGKKLLFMGSEFAQDLEWRFEYGLEWTLLANEKNFKMKNYVKDLNHLYKEEKSMHEIDNHHSGFDFIDPHNINQSVIVIMRKGKKKEDFIIAVLNFTPIVYSEYRIGVPYRGFYTEVFNSDNKKYYGSGQTMQEQVLESEDINWHNKQYSINIKVPPLGATFIKGVNLSLND